MGGGRALAEAREAQCWSQGTSGGEGGEGGFGTSQGKRGEEGMTEGGGWAQAQEAQCRANGLPRGDRGIGEGDALFQSSSAEAHSNSSADLISLPHFAPFTELLQVSKGRVPSRRSGEARVGGE